MTPNEINEVFKVIDKWFHIIDPKIEFWNLFIYFFHLFSTF